jgi:uncharacterized protein
MYFYTFVIKDEQKHKSSKFIHTAFCESQELYIEAALRRLPQFFFTLISIYNIQLKMFRFSKSVQNLSRTIPKKTANAFSTSSNRAKEYLAIIYDKPGMLQRRLEVREKHLEVARPDNRSGLLPLGGGLAEEFPETGQQFQFVGSTLIVSANSKAEALERLKQDIYYTSGVWDLDNALIFAVCDKNINNGYL